MAGKEKMKSKVSKKKLVTAKVLRIELELANSALLNEQLYKDLGAFKEHKKLQKQIHDRQSWKGYVR